MMNQRLILVLGLVALLKANSAFGKITTESLVKDAGYPFEVHTVQTEDGYLLDVHRIPSSPRNESCSENDRPIAFLMHGLECSSSDWVVLGRDEALGFNLADNCYDVWMGNARGNFYSRKHISLNPDSLLGTFWDFSFHEIGEKDLPAMIDFVRNETGKNKLHFIGHSVGTTEFFILTSLKPEYQDYIKSAHLMMPLAFSEYINDVFLNAANALLSLLNPLPNLLGHTEFKPNGTITKLAGAALCDSKPRELCSNILFLLTGFDEKTVKPAILGEVQATTPAGISTKCYLHCFQVYNSKEFQQYDYGFLGNLGRYGSAKPPTYPIENIKVPIYLYWGEKDKLIHKPDIDRLNSILPNVKLVLEIKNATHQYPLSSAYIHDQLYGTILENVRSEK